MSRQILAFLSLGFFCLIGCERDASKQSFSERFIEANQAKDIQPMLSLYHLEGSDDSTFKMLSVALEYELGLPIKQIDFEELTGSPEETIRFTHNGKVYGPTLEPKARMRVVYDTKDRFESRFTIGQLDDGQWRIISSKPIE